MRCPRHVDYMPFERPKESCLFCWYSWLKTHPKETITAADMLMLLNMVSINMDGGVFDRIENIWPEGHKNRTFGNVLISDS